MTEARASHVGRPSACPGGVAVCPPSADLLHLARRISIAVGHLEVSIAGRDSPLPWSCADVIAGQERGEDPTATWRDTVRRNQSELYGVDAPERVAVAFVMQWYLGVIATPVALAAALGQYVLPAEPAAIRFDLSDEEGYPVAVAVAVEAWPVVRVRDAAARMGRARRRYTAHAERFVSGYRPPVKMSTRQRSGMITDAWALALSSAGPGVQVGDVEDDGEGATGAVGLLGEPPWRTSCCFIFALPGAQACARCPRNRPSGLSLREP